MSTIKTGHLRVYHRDGRFIVFNPTIPSWIYTNTTGTVLLKLLSYTKTVGDAMSIAIDNGLDRDSCRRFFEEAASQQLFIEGLKSERWSEAHAFGRKLGSIYLHLTNSCNLSCAYCYRNSSPKIEIKRFGAEFTGFLDQCTPILSDRPVLTFTGGEPMIHPDFFLVAQHAQSLNFKNLLLTNGLSITEDNAAEIGRLFSYVKISLDGATEGTHAKTRGAGNFDAVLRSIWLLASLGGTLEIEVQMTLTFDNIAECEELRSILPKSVRTKFTPMMPMGRGLQADSYLESAEFLAVKDRVTPKDRRGGGSLQSGKRSFGCYAGEAHISVSDTGDIYPCHLFHNSKFRMGNIFIDSIEKIFYSQRMIDFGRSMDVESNNERCSSCDFRYLCGGGCKANPLHKYGDYRRSDTYCAFIRKTSLERMFEGYPSAPVVEHAASEHCS